MGIFTRSNATPARDAELMVTQQNAARLERDVERLTIERDALKRVARNLRKMIDRTVAQASTERLTRERDTAQRTGTLEGRVRELEVRARIAESNFEWNRLMFNKSEHERALLMQRILERPVQAFTLDREPGASIATPEKTPDVAGLASLAGIDFEDIGDAAAKALGLDHDDQPAKGV